MSRRGWKSAAAVAVSLVLFSLGVTMAGTDKVDVTIRLERPEVPAPIGLTFAFYPIVKAVVAESHRHKVPVYIHATELETARKAVQAGGDVLVHSITDRPVDDAFLKLAKEKKVFYVPTLRVFNSYGAVYSRQLKLMKLEHWLGNPRVIGSLFHMYELADKELGPRQKKLLAAKKPIRPNPMILKNLKRVHDAGIPVVMGTDAIGASGSNAPHANVGPSSVMNFMIATTVIFDLDADGIPYHCDTCGGFDDNGPDSDGDGEPDACDKCNVPGDSNCDGVVDFKDLGILCNNWLAGTGPK